jgi:uncharacterized membrane protein HdeD (DUF308 family)
MLPTNNNLTKLTFKLRVLTLCAFIIGIMNNISEAQFFGILAIYLIVSGIFYSIKRFENNKESSVESLSPAIA